jgi:aminoglycoside phosphotransferase (APT) family kinase protein
MTQRMHADEVDTDADLVRRLLAAQFPQWAALPIGRVASAGTDNALYRIGDDLVARLPRIHWAVDKVEHEQRWLPWLAPQLPFPIPAPLALGKPAEGYPHQWSVYRWLEGEMATDDLIGDPRQFASDLAGFVSAMQRIDPANGPPAPYGRGDPLETKNVGERVPELEAHAIDVAAVSAAWEAAVAAPAWDRKPVWLHGDLQSGNVLVVDGRLSSVIDFGCVGVGDPAVDVAAAWILLAAGSREVFREALDVDDATWARSGGWALSLAVGAITYYHETNPVLAGIGRRALEAVLEDAG